MKRLIVVVGANSRRSSSVIEALLEYSDQWLVRCTTININSSYIQVFDLRFFFEGNYLLDCSIGTRRSWCRNRFM